METFNEDLNKIAGAVMVGAWPLLPNIVQMLSVTISLV